MTFSKKIARNLHQADFTSLAGIKYVNDFLNEYSVDDFALSDDFDVRYLQYIVTNPTLTPERLSLSYSFTVGTDNAIPDVVLEDHDALNTLVKKGELSQWNVFVAAHYAQAHNLVETMEIITSYASQNNTHDIASMDREELADRYTLGAEYIIDKYLIARGIDIEMMNDSEDREILWNGYHTVEQAHRKAVSITNRSNEETSEFTHAVFLIGIEVYNFSIRTGLPISDLFHFPEGDKQVYEIKLEEDGTIINSLLLDLGLSFLSNVTIVK